MPGKTDKAPLSQYANPAFYNSPPACSLPIPKFMKRLRSGSGVRLTPERRDSLLDAITHIQQAPTTSEESNTKSEPVSVTSETESHNAKTATSEVKAQDKPTDMVRCNSPRCSSTSCPIHDVQKPEATPTASVQQKVVSDDLDKHPIEANERLRRHRVSETEKLQRHQQAIIDQLESETANILIQNALQARVECQPHNPAIPANIQRAALQLCMNQLIDATAQRAVDALMEYKRSTDHLQQVTIRMLERNRAEQREIEQEGILCRRANNTQRWAAAAIMRTA